MWFEAPQVWFEAAQATETWFEATQATEMWFEAARRPLECCEQLLCDRPRKQRVS